MTVHVLEQLDEIVCAQRRGRTVSALNGLVNLAQHLCRAATTQRCTRTRRRLVRKDQAQRHQPSDWREDAGCTYQHVEQHIGREENETNPQPTIQTQFFWWKPTSHAEREEQRNRQRKHKNRDAQSFGQARPLLPPTDRSAMSLRALCWAIARRHTFFIGQIS